MWNEWITCWAIAVVVWSVGGYILYNRGYDAGNKQTSVFITSALADAKVMAPETLLKHCERYANKVYGPVPQDDEES